MAHRQSDSSRPGVSGARAAAWNCGTRTSCARLWKPQARTIPGAAPVQQKIGDYWAACMDESAIEAAGLKPLAAGTRAHRRPQVQERHHARDRPSAAPLSRRLAAGDNQTQLAVLWLHRTAGLRQRIHGRRADRSGRTEPSQPRLLSEDRRQIERTARQSIAPTFRRCSCSPANPKLRPPPTPARSSSSKPPWRRRKWITSSAAIPRTSTTG